MAKGAIRIDWYPNAALDGMKFLTVLEELAYRRIIDLLYTNGGSLPNDDETMAEQTRTFEQWPKVKAGLIRKEKITCDDEGIRNEKCTDTLQEIQRLIEVSRQGGKASGKARRVLKEKKREPKTNPPSISVDEKPAFLRTETQPSYLVSESFKEEDDDNAREPEIFDSLGWPADRSTWIASLEKLIPNFEPTEGMFKSRTVIVAWHEVDKFEWQDVAFGIEVTIRNSADPPRSWKYFAGAISQARANRTTPTAQQRTANGKYPVNEYQQSSRGLSRTAIARAVKGYP